MGGFKYELEGQKQLWVEYVNGESNPPRGVGYVGVGIIIAGDSTKSPEAPFINQYGLKYDAYNPMGIGGGGDVYELGHRKAMSMAEACRIAALIRALAREIKDSDPERRAGKIWTELGFMEDEDTEGEKAEPLPEKSKKKKAKRKSWRRGPRFKWEGEWVAESQCGSIRVKIVRNMTVIKVQVLHTDDRLRGRGLLHKRVEGEGTTRERHYAIYSCLTPLLYDGLDCFTFGKRVRRVKQLYVGGRTSSMGWCDGTMVINKRYSKECARVWTEMIEEFDIEQWEAAREG